MSRDIRYLHTQHIEGRDPSLSLSADRPLESFSVFFPGWIDAEVFPWAKRLSAEPCEKPDCGCHGRPLRLVRIEIPEKK